MKNLTKLAIILLGTFSIVLLQGSERPQPSQSNSDERSRRNSAQSVSNTEEATAAQVRALARSVAEQAFISAKKAEQYRDQMRAKLAAGREMRANQDLADQAAHELIASAAATHHEHPAQGITTETLFTYDRDVLNARTGKATPPATAATAASNAAAQAAQNTGAAAVAAIGTNATFARVTPSNINLPAAAVGATAFHSTHSKNSGQKNQRRNSDPGPDRTVHAAASVSRNHPSGRVQGEVLYGHVNMYHSNSRKPSSSGDNEQAHTPSVQASAQGYQDQGGPTSIDLPSPIQANNRRPNRNLPPYATRLARPQGAGAATTHQPMPPFGSAMSSAAAQTHAAGKVTPRGYAGRATLYAAHPTAAYSVAGSGASAAAIASGAAAAPGINVHIANLAVHIVYSDDQHTTNPVFNQWIPAPSSQSFIHQQQSNASASSAMASDSHVHQRPRMGKVAPMDDPVAYAAHLRTVLTPATPPATASTPAAAAVAAHNNSGSSCCCNCCKKICVVM